MAQGLIPHSASMVGTCIQHGSQRSSRMHNLAQQSQGIRPIGRFGISVWPQMPLESVDPTPLWTSGQNAAGVGVARSGIHAFTVALGLVAFDGPERVYCP
jgi:hypothetical protein